MPMCLTLLVGSDLLFSKGFDVFPATILGSGSKGIAMKHGKKHIVLDDSRRSTYMHSYALSCGQDSSIFTTFNRERKQLIAVSIHPTN